MTGSKVALFGRERRSVEGNWQHQGNWYSRRDMFRRELLGVVHKIELDQGLPYTTFDGGVWAKLAEGARQLIRIMEVTDGRQDQTADAQGQGLNSLYVWYNLAGIHGEFSKDSSGWDYKPKNNASMAQLRGYIEGLHAKGFYFGNHSLNGFVNYRDDPYSWRHRVQYIATNQRSTLAAPLSAADTSMTLTSAAGFRNSGHVVIDKEVIQYSGKSGNRLTGLTRGKSCVHNNCGMSSTVFSNPATAAAHLAGAEVGDIHDGGWGGNDPPNQSASAYPGIQRSRYWGSSTSVPHGTNYGRVIGDLGIDFISVDGVESYELEHPQLGPNAYYKALFDALPASKHLSSEASRLTPYNWHFHDRWMWGETGQQVLLSGFRRQMANLINRWRNLLLNNMPGGISVNTNNLNDFHFWGSRIAAHRTGALVKRDSTPTNAGKAAALRRWIEASEARAFSDLQRMRMQQWGKSFHLDSVAEGRRWRLWERSMTLTGRVSNDPDPTSVSYGNTKTNPYLVARPWAGYPTRNVAGDAAVSEVSRRDKGFAGENAVDGSIGFSEVDLNQAQIKEISEWQAAQNASNPWLQLTWDTPQRVRHVLLQDRSWVYHNDGQVKAYSLALQQRFGGDGHESAGLGRRVQ